MSMRISITNRSRRTLPTHPCSTFYSLFHRLPYNYPEPTDKFTSRRYRLSNRSIYSDESLSVWASSTPAERVANARNRRSFRAQTERQTAYCQRAGSTNSSLDGETDIQTNDRTIEAEDGRRGMLPDSRAPNSAVSTNHQVAFHRPATHQFVALITDSLYVT